MLGRADSQAWIAVSRLGEIPLSQPAIQFQFPSVRRSTDAAMLRSRPSYLVPSAQIVGPCPTHAHSVFVLLFSEAQPAARPNALGRPSGERESVRCASVILFVSLKIGPRKWPAVGAEVRTIPVGNALSPRRVHRGAGAVVYTFDRAVFSAPCGAAANRTGQQIATANGHGLGRLFFLSAHG